MVDKEFTIFVIKTKVWWTRNSLFLSLRPKCGGQGIHYFCHKDQSVVDKEFTIFVIKTKVWWTRKDQSRVDKDFTTFAIKTKVLWTRNLLFLK